MTNSLQWKPGDIARLIGKDDKSKIALVKLLTGITTHPDTSDPVVQVQFIGSPSGHAVPSGIVAVFVSQLEPLGLEYDH